MKRPVVLDIDGVLADFCAGYRRICQQISRPEPVISRWDDFLDPAVWKAIRASTDFWVSLPPRVSYQTFRRIGMLRDERDVYFATSRCGPHSHWQTVDWLEGLMMRRPSVIVTSKKGEFARVVDAEFLLDDKAGNVVYTQYQSPTTRPFLLDAPYNQFDHDVLGSKVRRVDTVEEFLDIVEAA